MNPIERKGYLHQLRFPNEIEQAFQESYYSRTAGSLRITMYVLVGISLLLALGHLLTGDSWVFVLAFALVAATNWYLLRSALSEEFARVWQPLLTASSLATVTVALSALTSDTLQKNDLAGFMFFSCAALLVCRLLRLQSRWHLRLQVGIQAVTVLAILFHMPSAWEGALGFLIGSSILIYVPTLLTRKRERFERDEFLDKFLLAQERNEERSKREQTEKMLHVLSQAIGSIVHDLGNPLTSVQTGAETLLAFVESGDADKEMVQEFAEIITDGAQMLNHLRLSLMEQTRVLEGKPIPITLRSTSIRSVIEAGARYQKPKFSSGRQVNLRGDDIEVAVDDMKMVTVFMNLIGNALKYSDGPVDITWRTDGDRFLVAVLDEGKSQRGISQSQAEQLFVPFGRLDTHAEIEGTGLGLLSVQKIVDAHGGEIYIEGYGDGTSQSAAFKTSQGIYPTVLSGQFRTAFVVACPFQPTSPEDKTPDSNVASQIAEFASQPLMHPVELKPTQPMAELKTS